MTESESVEVQELQTVHELLTRMDLVGVRYHEIVGRLVEEPGVGSDDGTATYDDVLGPDSGAKFAIEVGVRHHLSDFEPRFKLSVTHPEANYVIDISTLYRSESEVAFPEEVGVEFIERVAVMAAFPFMREALAFTAARLEVTVPIMGLLKAGQFKMGNPSPTAGS